MRTLNLGILAHVDAGKTSLTERLLYAAGIIDAVGSVDAGNTQTDTLAQERARGITIKAAVVSFEIADVTVNLIDTPGHPDFIAEVERVLSLLDGAVLVVSAVEGVQAQTRVLMRTLKRLGIPTLIFVNKIDRGGADPAGVLTRIAATLTPDILAMGEVSKAGRREAAMHLLPEDHPSFAEHLAEHDDDLLAAYVADEAGLGQRRLRRALARQSRRGVIHPVYFGSAITGAGVAELLAAIPVLLPATAADEAAPLSGTVFKVERGHAGERIAYARLFSGAVHLRDRISFGAGDERRVTGIEVFEKGTAYARPALTAGRIGRLKGLGEVRIGDALGAARAAVRGAFAPPTLETVIEPAHPRDKVALLGALGQLAEQDPLINLRQDDLHGEIYLSLFGEVQKEVIRDTLAADFGLAVAFRETRPICIERVLGSGAALFEPSRKLLARVGLRIDPAPLGAGVSFKLEVESGAMPAAFFTAVEDGVRETLRQGLRGWEVQDVAVAMTHVIRYRHYATSTPADHRKLTPLVVMKALKAAGTVVCEPVHHFHLTLPGKALEAVLPALTRYEAVLQSQMPDGASMVLEGDIPAGRVHGLQQEMPGLTGGEGVLDCAFDHYRPVRGDPPERPRTDNNPLDRTIYMQNISKRG